MKIEKASAGNFHIRAELWAHSCWERRAWLGRSCRAAGWTSPGSAAAGLRGLAGSLGQLAAWAAAGMMGSGRAAGTIGRAATIGAITLGVIMGSSAAGKSGSRAAVRAAADTARASVTDAFPVKRAPDSALWPTAPPTHTHTPLLSWFSGLLESIDHPTQPPNQPNPPLRFRFVQSCLLFSF